MSDLISRQAVLNVIKANAVWKNEYNLTSSRIKTAVESLPSEQSKWNDHKVACLLAELFGDACACNYNGIDEWLPEKCELLSSCPNPGGVACWEQFLKHKAESEETRDDNEDN